MADEPGDAVGDSEEQFSGLRGDQVWRRGGGGEAMVEHGVDERGVGLGGEPGVGDDALGEGGVLLQTKTTIEARVTDEPDGEVIAAVEAEAGEAVELVEDLVAEGLGVIEDDDGDDAAFVRPPPACNSRPFGTGSKISSLACIDPPALGHSTERPPGAKLTGRRGINGEKA